MSRYRFIDAERARYPVVLLCRVLRVARSAYYASAGGGVSARASAGAALAAQIGAVHARSRRTYGAPRVHAELRATGVRCARKRVARLMRAAGLTSCHRRRRIRTTVADPDTRPKQGWLSLAVLVDACSRPVVVWAMADRRRAELAADALAMALGRRRPAAGLVRHIDRGGQYTPPPTRPRP